VINSLIPEPKPRPATALVFNNGEVEAPYRIRMVDEKGTPIWELSNIVDNPFDDLVNKSTQEEPAFFDSQCRPLIVTVEDRTTYYYDIQDELDDKYPPKETTC